MRSRYLALARKPVVNMIICHCVTVDPRVASCTQTTNCREKLLASHHCACHRASIVTVLLICTISSCLSRLWQRQKSTCVTGRIHVRSYTTPRCPPLSPSRLWTNICQIPAPPIRSFGPPPSSPSRLQGADHHGWWGVFRAAYEEGESALVSQANLEMLCLTWNVNEQRPEGSPLFNWIADLSGKASIAVVALQEIEMGSSSVAIAAAKDVLNKSAQVSVQLHKVKAQPSPCPLVPCQPREQQ